MNILFKFLEFIGDELSKCKGSQQELDQARSLVHKHPVRHKRGKKSKHKPFKKK